MKNFLRQFLAVLAVLVLLSIIFVTFQNASKNVATVPLSEVANKIQSGEVKAIHIDGDNLTLTLNDGTILKSQKEDNVSLIQTLSYYGVTPKSLDAVRVDVASTSSGAGFWLGAILQVVLPLLLIFVFFWYLSRQAQKGAMQAFSFGKANIRIFANPKERVTFKDVAGLKEAKEELVEVVDFLRNAQKFIDIGARVPRGVLLIGPPGSGKTLLARAVAGEANVPFFHISGSEFVEMFVGVGASRVRDLFATAKRSAPAIIFIDEIDAVGRERGAGLGGGHDEREQTLNQILVEMDGFERDTNVIVMAATNRPDILDPALLRPGRFDRRVVLDLPDIKEREEILAIHAKGKRLTSDVDLKVVAQRTPGFSGADLANLINEAAIFAARKNRREISQQDILDSIEKVILGPERRSRIFSKKEREITAYHEAGHAIVASALPHADPVQKISIVSRGRAAGYTLKMPVEDRRMWSRAQFEDDLATMLGGFAAEKIIFKDITTGASNDLRQASDLARKMVMQFGMSEKVGPIAYGGHDELIFLGREIAHEKNYSESIAAQIDNEVKGLIQRAHATARKIVISKRAILDRIAKRLIDVETIERAEFEKMVKGGGLVPAPVRIRR